MSPWTLWVCMILLIGTGIAVDVPFVFDETSVDVASYTSAQFEQARIASPDLAGVPYLSQPEDDEILAFPITGGGSSPDGAKERKVADLKMIMDSRVEPDNPVVHRDALMLAAKKPGDYTIEQVSAIYTYLKEDWHYVRDPRGVDYYMYANESLLVGKEAGCSGAGDCDDFAILMAAFIESIGGTTRIILARNETTGGHAYTEVYLGQLNSQNNQVDYALKWLMQKHNTNKIFTHIETDTSEVWLNLDWGKDEKGNSHPGGPYFPGEMHYVLCIRDLLGKTSINPPEGFEPNKPNLISNSNSVANNLDASALTEKAVAFINLGRYDEALQACDSAIEINPQYKNAWITKAWALIKLGRYDDSLLASDKAIELGPEDAYAWNNKAAALVNLGRYDEGLQVSEKTIELNPRFAKGWYNKGEALNNLGNSDEAMKCYNKSIELDSNNAIPWIGKSQIFVNSGKNEEGLQASEKALNIDPKAKVAWNNKGVALYGLGRYEEALLSYDKALEIDPKYKKAWNNKGKVLKALGHNSEADAAFVAAIEV